MNNARSLKNDSERIFDVSFTPFRNHVLKGVIGCGFTKEVGVLYCGGYVSHDAGFCRRRRFARRRRFETSPSIVTPWCRRP